MTKQQASYFHGVYPGDSYTARVSLYVYHKSVMQIYHSIHLSFGSVAVSWDDQVATPLALKSGHRRDFMAFTRQ